MRDYIDEVHLNYVTRVFQYEGIKGVIDNFLTTLIYSSDILKSYNLIGNFRKYTEQKMR